jgi:hypothetical protein
MHCPTTAVCCVLFGDDCNTDDGMLGAFEEALRNASQGI